jgi:signal transduction histidine kinase
MKDAGAPSVGPMRVVARHKSGAAALLLALVALCIPLGAMAAETKRVLLLHSIGREIVPYGAVVAAIRTKLAPVEPLAIYDASLDVGQTIGSDDLQPFLELLRHRFADSPPDVVVAIGPVAAALFLQNRDKVFPMAPVIIVAIDEQLLPKTALRAGDGAIVVRAPDSVAVDNILRLLPDTQRIAVIIGDSPLERSWLGRFHEQFARFSNRVNFEWLNDLSFEQMRRRVANLPAHSAVLFATLATDGAGGQHEPETALSSLLEVSTAPIFSYYESEFGHGVVGGPYLSQQRIGALTADSVLRVMNTQIRAMPAIEVTGYEAPVYDWRALKRWGIDPARLPAVREIRYRLPSLWDEHRALIVTALGILVLQAALLTGLLWQRIRRRHAEEEAQALSGRLIDAHEDERRWLARELHDDITQRLAALAIAAALLPESDSSSMDPDAPRSIRTGLIRLSEDVHNLSYRLHPSVLDDLGLVEALKAECDRVARVESVRVIVDAATLPQSLPREVALGIYRVAQEALRNVGRHAKASIVQLSLALSGGGLRLTVSDNGCGFKPSPQTRQPSLGHASIRERIRLLGGTLDIHSTPGGGTRIVAWVPIPKETL